MFGQQSNFSHEYDVTCYPKKKNYEVVNTVFIIAPIKLMPKHLYFVGFFFFFGLMIMNLKTMNAPFDRETGTAPSEYPTIKLH